MTDAMRTYSQYLSARHLAEVLLMKHSQESSEGSIVIYGDIQVDDEIKTLAERLGYRVEKIAQPVEMLEAGQ